MIFISGILSIIFIRDVQIIVLFIFDQISSIFCPKTTAPLPPSSCAYVGYISMQNVKVAEWHFLCLSMAAAVDWHESQMGQIPFHNLSFIDLQLRSNGTVVFSLPFIGCFLIKSLLDRNTNAKFFGFFK